MKLKTKLTLPNEEYCGENQLLRYSVSLVTQGDHRFYTLTVPSDVLAKTCFVTTREEDPDVGLLRMMGTSCMQLDSSQIQAMDHVADAFGLPPANGFESGFYIAQCHGHTNEIAFRKSTAARHGSHGILWEVFANKLREISNHLLTVSSKFTPLSLQLAEIETVLKQDGLNNGSWLSHIRNLANYRQDFGLWFPYGGSRVSASDLLKIVRKWDGQLDRLLPAPKGDPITLHVWLCTAIVAMCYAVVRDMETHGSGKKSFHSYGSLALTRMAV